MAAIPSYHLAQLTELGDVHYYVQPSPIVLNPDRRQILFGKPSVATSSTLSPLPVSVFLFPDKDEKQTITAGLLDDTINRWLDIDDVFDSSFLSHVLLVRKNSTLYLDGSIETAAKDWNINVIESVQTSSTCTSGPYFLQGDSLAKALRIFPDTTGAFMFPVIPRLDDPTTYTIPPTSGIPVPSGLHYDPPSERHPLSGLRVAVKDNIDLKGVKTSAGNRAFQDLYAPPARSALAVEQLLLAGAVVVGKAKTVQFASGENARDWVDFQPPFNVRADGYQDPGRSSAGNAAATSAYDWIDLSLATDTFGSVLGPAADHGVFGLRFGNAVVGMNGVVPMSQRLDSLGIMSRRIETITEVSRVLAKDVQRSDSCPAIAEILYPLNLMEPTSQYLQPLVDRFVDRLENFIGRQKRLIDLGQMFIDQSVAHGLSMNDYMEETVAHIQLYECYQNFVPFHQKYWAEYKKQPFADPFIQFKWDLGKNISDDQYNEAESQYNTFKTWFQREVLPSSSDHSHFPRLDRFLIMPSGRVTPKYRHQYDGKTLEQGARMKQGFGFKGQTIVIVGEVPMVIIPIGQIPYHSDVSDREEWLPASIGLAGPKNSDAELLEFVSAFLRQAPDLRSTVATGPVAYSSGKEAGKV